MPGFMPGIHASFLVMAGLVPPIHALLYFPSAMAGVYHLSPLSGERSTSERSEEVG